MQVEIKQVNAVNQEVTLIIEAERATKKYNKYLEKAGKEVAVPGFRKGKAPISMVERMYSDRIMDLFYKEMVDDCFDEAAKEHDIHYLLYPEVKDITWSKDEAMTIVIQIECEPTIEFKQLEGMQIPYKPLILDEEVDKFIADLQKENSYLVDVEDEVQENDEVECEIIYELEGKKVTKNAVIESSDRNHEEVFKRLLSKKIGDVVEEEIEGFYLTPVVDDVNIESDDKYKASFMINAIRRRQVPELNDEFAKDMDFESLEAMRTKITEDLRLMVHDKNINIENAAVIAKLFIDNRFDLPEKTLNHIAEKETESISDPKWKPFYLYQIKMQIAQEMINLYTLNNLKRIYDIEVSEEDQAQYIEHNAILEDKTIEAWKVINKDFILKKDFLESVKNYSLLRLLASKNEFIIAPESDENAEMPEAIDTEQQAVVEEPKETQAELFNDQTEEK